MVHPGEHETLIATWCGRTYLLRVFEQGFEEAMKDYRVLKHAGINMAKICFHDDNQKIIVFDYFPEDDCLTDLSKGPLSDLHFEALFALYRFARFSKVALDWEPQNFMLRGSQMFYLPTKWEPMTEKNRLEDNLMTWFLGPEGIGLLKKKGFDVSKLPHMGQAEANKTAVLTAIKCGL